MKKMIVVMMVALFAATAAPSEANGTDNVITELQTDDILCSIRIRGTYDGKPVDLTVTVEAENCAKAAGEMLRSITAQK